MTERENAGNLANLNEDFQRSFTHSRPRPPQPPPVSRPQPAPAETQDSANRVAPQNTGE